MKFAAYSDDSRAHVAVLDRGLLYRLEGVEDLTAVVGEGLEALLARGEAALQGEGIALESVRLEAPVKPYTLRDSMCFHEHIENCMGEIDPLHRQFPAFYLSNPLAVLGPSDEVPISPGCEAFDYEMEVAAVIGRAGGNIAPADAPQHIIGYTMYIDWSARDLQMEDMKSKLGPGKGKDGATTLGPMLVTADEFESLRSEKGFDISMSVSLNGRQISTGNWNSINWSFDDVIAYTSRGTRLTPGDVLGSGTVGKGCLFEQRQIDPENFPGWLKPGDVVTFEVDLIGRMDLRITEADLVHRLSSGY